ncbi:hypothetical protein [Pseudomonas aeruginosa]|uniref:hypothetical protein n=1 Tax=Pseudomonas aeruginosa TaxID=287 RepID=UPI000FC40ECC|nr:hypothetical protein [Pseudomonas aeruginosa]RUF61056.1 hypothetical protein IPC1106_25920 [Pseudomonas aeruginosa]
MDHSVPLVYVFFRRLNGNQLTNDFVRRRIALSRLCFYQPGYILADNAIAGRVATEAKWFDVNFRIAGNNWKLKQASELKLCHSDSPFPLPKYCEKDWLIEFDIAGGKLLLNCVEFLVRAYSRRSEIPRILTTYHWGEAKSRLLAQDTPESELIPRGKAFTGDEKWIVYPHKNMVKDDDIFLAHIANDKTYAVQAASQIFAQLDTDDFKSSKALPIQVRPWFNSETQLKCRGFWFDNGKSFYCTELIGLQEPAGIPVEARRDSVSSTPTPADIIERERLHLLRKDPITLALTDVKQPRSDYSREEVEDSNFEVKHTRKVERVKVPKLTSRQRTIHDTGLEIENFSTGDPGGQRNATTGKVVLATREFGVNSEGILYEMWKSFERLKVAQKIQNLWWFTPPDKRCSESAFQCIQFTEDLSNIKRSKWLRLKRGGTRGLLLMIIRAGKKFYLVVEIERDNWIDKNGDFKEDSYSGLICEVANSEEVAMIFTQLDVALPSEKGIFKNIKIKFPAKNATFEHRQTGNPNGWFDATAALALRKMGLKNRQHESEQQEPDLD